MVHWAYLIVSVFVGFGFGVFAIALLAAGGDETADRAGFVEGHHEGHTDGFADGLKSFNEIG